MTMPRLLVGRRVTAAGATALPGFGVAGRDTVQWRHERRAGAGLSQGGFLVGAAASEPRGVRTGDRALFR